MAAEWALRINGAVARHAPQRPGALLVLVNPFGGARRARRTWRRIAEPILEAAGARGWVCRRRGQHPDCQAAWCGVGVHADWCM